MHTITLFIFYIIDVIPPLYFKKFSKPCVRHEISFSAESHPAKLLVHYFNISSNSQPYIDKAVQGTDSIKSLAGYKPHHHFLPSFLPWFVQYRKN